MGAEVPGSAEGAVVVYLTGAPTRPTLLKLRREAESLMQSAGYEIEWRDSAGPRGLDAPNLVVLQLAGDCSAPTAPTPDTPSVETGRSLASAAVQDGVVLPFARIDCAAVRSVLAPLVAREAPARRAQIYGRAMGRLIAHELYHVLAQTRDHASSGIGKPCFTAADLVSDRFEFEPVTLARLRRPAADPADWSSDTGRQ